MTVGSSLHLLHELCVAQSFPQNSRPKSFRSKEWNRVKASLLSSNVWRKDARSVHVSNRTYKSRFCITYKCSVFKCQSFNMPSTGDVIPHLRNTTLALTRSCNALFGSHSLQLIPAVGLIAFSIWGLGPMVCYLRSLFSNDSNWKKSKTYYISTSYVQPLLLWTGTMLICRFLDPVVLPSEASQIVKNRFLNFIRSLSSVLAIAYCFSCFIQQSQKFFTETSADDTRKMSFQFAGRAVYTAVWVAAVSLFMELLGFSTHKWVTAGGLGTVLLTLAGREIFTNFLSSVMIHATRPFVVNQWIQTKIEGYDVSGIVEHVGWWSPTIIRGEDREAVHIPNHKFTVNVVRNLSQKTHWRIKTHIAISHLDVDKIGNIIADMRKVLAKKPQIEQQRLHRRVFLDIIDPENQALMILISCFVKTSHVEQYHCVKESVMLDLLRVISHHRARLATPIRTVQKIYNDTDAENIPFADSAFRHPASSRHSFFLIDSQSRLNSEDKFKPRANQDQINKTAATIETKSVPSTGGGNSSRHQRKADSGDALPKNMKAGIADAPSFDFSSTSQLCNPDTEESTPRVDSQKPSASVAVGEGVDTKNVEKVQSKKLQAPKPVFEDNIVLGVALEGSKLTLPIEEGMSSSAQFDGNEVTFGSSVNSPIKTSKEIKGSVDKRDHDS
ncbi:mechanosensitive ion channel protein 2, chloroplastic-like isoform X1 [Zingiber officinale]|nr:mechanosensitive ion channel protein 2, chloroplastic-like isoform X1 [Zingiber officinale]XP_042452358.1 mechanosensitive ion channel protein 2, chloroplastic-like isoform X1 [Zingiber officinale]